MTHASARFRFAAIFGVGGIATLTLMGPGCAETHEGDATSSPTGSGSSELYDAPQQLWPGGLIDVCFEPTADPNALSGQSIVRNWVTGTWERSGANISFNGWGTCDNAGTGAVGTSPNDGIRIVFNDVNPASQVGLLGRGIVGMNLDNTWVAWKPPVRGVATNVQLGWIAVHEFGHALGFPHEQDRPDTLSSVTSADVGYDGTTPVWTELACVQSYIKKSTQDGGVPIVMDWYDESSTPYGNLVPIGTYDHVSVMNYCNTDLKYNNFGQLSPGDVAGVQTAYPMANSHLINDGSDPVASEFPTSTVNLQTPGNTYPSCTGVILTTNATTTQILTAAHCKVNNTTAVRLFETSPPLSSPSGYVYPVSATTPVKIQNGVVCDPDTVGSIPSTCYATNASGSLYYADLAVVTVDSPMPAGYVAVALGASSSLSGAPDSATTAWEVGTETGFSMRWAPTFDIGAEVNGYFVAGAPFVQRGEGGGPVYMNVAAPLTSQNGLVLMGIASTFGQCATETPCRGNSNTYVSVVNPDNYAWLTGLGAAPAQVGADASAGADIATFGAAE